MFPRAFYNNSLCKIWRANRVNYGELENRELTSVLKEQSTYILGGAIIERFWVFSNMVGLGKHLWGGLSQVRLVTHVYFRQEEVPIP